MRGRSPLALSLILACCPDGDHPPIPDGVEVTASCAGAGDEAPARVIAGRRFCGLGEFEVEAVRGDYRDVGEAASAGYTFDAARFTAELDGAFAAASPRGHAWILVQGNAAFGEHVVARGSGGLAITAADAGGEAVPFAGDTPSNLGSVTKFLAALALVHAHEHTQAGRPEAERVGLRELLQVPLVELFPERWRGRFDPDNGLREVRIGELLLHTARIKTVAQVSEVDDILESLEYNAGLASLDENAIGYSNVQSRLLYLVIATMLDPEGLRAIEREDAGRCDDAFDDRYLRRAAAITRAHLRDVMLAAVPGGAPGTECDPRRLGEGWARRLAWAYRDDADERGTYYDSYAQNRGYCSTTGGWFASVDDLGAILWAYHGGGLIGADARAVLEGGSGMGWYIYGRPALTFPDAALEATTAIPGILRKHGAQTVPDTDDTYRASIFKLPFGYYVALLVNSNYADGSIQGQRTVDVMDAFAAAIEIH